MVDSLLDLGSFSILDIETNWRQLPTTGFETAFNVLGFEGTSNEAISYDDNKPETFQFQILLEDKVAYNNFLTNWLSLKGRLGCFWYVDLSDRFTLNQAAIGTDVSLNVKDSTITINGFERLYLEKFDGSRITRKITSKVQNVSDIDLVFSDPLGQAVNLNEVKILTLLHLARFNNDTASIRAQSECTSEVNVEILTLPKEQILV